MNAILKLRTPSLTVADLAVAFESVNETSLARDGTTARVLNGFFDVLTVDAVNDSDPARVPDGRLPVTVAQVDAALEEAREEGLPRKPLAILRQARELLARAEAEQAAIDAQPVTRGEFEAEREARAIIDFQREAASRENSQAESSLSYRLERVLREDRELRPAVRVVLKRYLELMTAASAAETGMAQMREARRMGGRRGLHF